MTLGTKRDFRVAEDVAEELREQVNAWEDGQVSSEYLLDQVRAHLSLYEGREVKAS